MMALHGGGATEQVQTNVRQERIQARIAGVLCSQLWKATTSAATQLTLLGSVYQASGCWRT